MYCPKCGAQVDEGKKYCDNCGYPLAREAGPEKKKTPIFILVIVIILEIAVIAGVGGMILFKTMNKGEGSSKPVQPTAAPTPTKEAEPTVTPKPTATPAPTMTPTPEPTPTEVPAIEPTLLMDVEAAAAIKASHWKISADKVVSAGASSTIKQEKVQNPPINILDGDEMTNWQEGVDGSGIGESLYFTFDQEYDIDALTLKLGNWKTDDYYYGNNRPKTLKIVTADQEWSMTFPEERMEFSVQFTSPVRTGEFKVVIEDVYKGTKWDDTVITDICLWCK